jgi:copper chaperone
MNRRRVLIAFIFTLALTLGASAVSAVTRTVTLRVKGMTCGGCAASVEKALKSTDGVTDVKVSFEKGKAVVKYNDQKVTVARLREVVDNTGMSCDVDGAPGKGR